jgi:hypothetical protein
LVEEYAYDGIYLGDQNDSKTYEGPNAGYLAATLNVPLSSKTAPIIKY